MCECVKYKTLPVKPNKTDIDCNKNQDNFQDLTVISSVYTLIQNLVKLHVTFLQ